MIADDPTKPNEAYVRHVDFIIIKAEELGMFVGVLSKPEGFSNPGQFK
jgi:hypothetical protein